MNCLEFKVNLAGDGSSVPGTFSPGTHLTHIKFTTRTNDEPTGFPVKYETIEVDPPIYVAYDILDENLNKVYDYIQLNYINIIKLTECIVKPYYSTGYKINDQGLLDLFQYKEVYLEFEAKKLKDIYDPDSLISAETIPFYRGIDSLYDFKNCKGFKYTYSNEEIYDIKIFTKENPLKTYLFCYSSLEFIVEDSSKPLTCKGKFNTPEERNNDCQIHTHTYKDMRISYGIVTKL